ncbi:collagen triple helix repeat-containing protein 1-like [Corticium candelabrum]|uniref:collagen triple helix repeat-containing protein 1-like n=1 Tax=Corticium candelabrum TaxID=121492 RepID=UPI002E257684|nr:collagen triple helix repeat-containing protein 1-like [Corticium candelabrum]
MGEKGEAGPQGSVGPKGNSGKVGARGLVGAKGMKGVDGSKGSKGDQGAAVKVNWKQCVWDREDSKDNGVIQECRFTKRSGNSALRVAYAGNLRVYCGSHSACCSRWYFTFNGGECSGPMTIEGLVYSNRKGDSVHRHRQIEGYCENIPAGQIKVAFHVGKCARWTGTLYDAHTGWDSTSRIIIEETSPAQQE